MRNGRIAADIAKQPELWRGWYSLMPSGELPFLLLRAENLASRGIYEMKPSATRTNHGLIGIVRCRLLGPSVDVLFYFWAPISKSNRSARIAP
jgi:hypothetical protein